MYGTDKICKAALASGTGRRRKLVKEIVVTGYNPTVTDVIDQFKQVSGHSTHEPIRHRGLSDAAQIVH